MIQYNTKTISSLIDEAADFEAAAGSSPAAQAIFEDSQEAGVRTDVWFDLDTALTERVNRQIRALPEDASYDAYLTCFGSNVDAIAERVAAKYGLI